MDAFEQVVSEILWMSGFWVRTSVKVELTKEEKRLIGRHSSPRWELDIVGYSGRENFLRVVECKSFLDSVGVRACAFDGSDPEEAKRYKLFNEPDLRRIVFNRLCLQFRRSAPGHKSSPGIVANAADYRDLDAGLYLPVLSISEGFLDFRFHE
jgi:hypothetical protein